MLAGETSRATIQTLQLANKHLRFAKEFADVGLDYRHLGTKGEMNFIVYSDASFACRSGNNSQGGYLLAICHKDVAAGLSEGYYNVLDWRSWKLPRIARSTLSAEAQAACDASDALMFAVQFCFGISCGSHSYHSIKLKVDSFLTNHVWSSMQKDFFDVLTKDEIQAATSADERTTIEALVCQDKLACCHGKTAWVSSELQYADGLTKQSGATLLAQRLRSCMTRLRSDESFQASKKKTPLDRKRNTERYAVKCPERALAAMMASCMFRTTYAMNTTNSLEEPFDNTFMFLILFTMFIGVFMWFAVTKLVTKAWTTFNSTFTKASTLESTTQVYESEFMDYTDTFTQTERRQDPYQLLQELKAELEETRQKGLQAAKECRIWAAEYEKLKKKNVEDFEQRLKVEKQRSSLKPIYLAGQGSCWHASRKCLAGRTPGPSFERLPRSCCAHTLWDKSQPSAPPGGAHWSTTHGDLRPLRRT